MGPPRRLLWPTPLWFLEFKPEISIAQPSQRHHQADAQPRPRGPGDAATPLQLRRAGRRGDGGRGCGGGEALQPEVVLQGGVAVRPVRDANGLRQRAMTRVRHLVTPEQRSGQDTAPPRGRKQPLCLP